MTVLTSVKSILSKRSIQILLLVLSIALILFIVIQFEVKRYRTDIIIKPGMKYNVANIEYNIPNLNIKGKGYLLKEDFLIDIRSLFIKVKDFFESLNIEYWISGGTLIGFTRHNTFMPWDDDIDIHTHSYNRLFMFSDKFKNNAKDAGLECLYMRGMTNNFSYYKGGVRLRELGKKNPVLDIFFVEQVEDRMIKIENWYGNSVSYNKKENWHVNDILNIKKEQIDNLTVYKPQNPHNVLVSQYGENYNKEMYCDEKYHTIAYDFFENIIWTN